MKALRDMEKVNRSLRSLYSDLRAIAVLFQVDMEMQALAIIYGAIDRAAWLICQGEDNSGSDFKDWVNNFLIPGQHHSFNADDLWAARCALLHTGAAESRDYRKNKARLIYYKVKQSQPDAKLLQDLEPWLEMIGVDPGRVVLVDHFWLAKEFADGLKRFTAFLAANPTLADRAASKAEMLLTFQKYTPPE